MISPELDDLPDEVIVRIFQFSRPEDRKELSLVNKRFNMIYKHRIPDIEFCYHLNAKIQQPLRWRSGLDYLLKRDHSSFQVLRLSGLYLVGCLYGGKSHCVIRNEYFKLAVDSEVCKNITDIQFFECGISDEVLIKLRILFPNLSSLTLSDCLFEISGDKSRDLIQRRKGDIGEEEMLKAPIKNLKITMPFVSATDSGDRYFRWIINYCGNVDMLNLELPEGSECMNSYISKQYKDTHTYTERNKERIEHTFTSISKREAEELFEDQKKERDHSRLMAHFPIGLRYICISDLLDTYVSQTYYIQMCDQRLR